MLATAPGDPIPMYEREVHTRNLCPAGSVNAPSVNVYLRTTADRSMYYYRTRTHRWLAMPKLSDRPLSTRRVYGERSEHLRRGLAIF